MSATFCDVTILTFHYLLLWRHNLHCPLPCNDNRHVKLRNWRCSEGFRWILFVDIRSVVLLSRSTPNFMLWSRESVGGATPAYSLTEQIVLFCSKLINVTSEIHWINKFIPFWDECVNSMSMCLCPWESHSLNLCHNSGIFHHKLADVQFFMADVQCFAAGLLLFYKLCIFLLLDYFHPGNYAFVLRNWAWADIVMRETP